MSSYSQGDDNYLYSSNDWIAQQQFHHVEIDEEEPLHGSLSSSSPQSQSSDEVNQELVPLTSVASATIMTTTSTDSPLMNQSNAIASSPSTTNSKTALVIQARELPFYRLQLNINNEFLINGDVYMSFESSDFSRIGSMNKYKRMGMVTLDKQLRQLTILLDSTQRGMDDFTHLISMCRLQPNRSIQMIADLLQAHQNRVSQLLRFTQMLKEMPRHEDFIEASEKCFITFQERCQKELKHMVQTSQIKFFKTKTVKVNLERGCYELQKISMSELLLAMLGLSTEQAQQFILRKGMFEFTFSLEEFGQELHFLEMYREDPDTYSFNSVLKTFDGMDLQCLTRFIIIHNTDNFLRQRAGLKLTDFFLIVDYDVTPSMLRQLVHYRKQEKAPFNIAQYENEQDWDYFIQSKEFISHFQYQLGHL